MINSATTLKYLLAAGLGLTLVGVIVGTNYFPTNKTNDSDVISHRLDTLQAQLGTLHEEVKKPVETVDLTAINQDFHKLTSLIEQLKNHNETDLNRLINDNRAELTQKLDVLREMVMSLDKKQHPIKYLPSSNLPFKVISIDSIQQVSVATVAYNFKTVPLEKSDQLAGWTVLSIDFGLQRMELENGNKEHVVVRMDVLQDSAFLIPILACHAVHADLTIPGLNQQPLNHFGIEDKTLAKTGLTVNEDALTSEQDINKITLTDTQLHEAKVWGLTSDEEKRYVLLMQNKSKLYYKGLRQTPIDILGLNARNETERNHFAELAARQEAQKVAKNIAWNNAFYKAYNKLFVNVPVIGDFDPSPYSPYAHKPVQLSQGDTLFFFIKEQDSVKTILLMLFDAIEQTPNARLHLMLLDMNDTTIQIWANQHQIPQHLVNGGRITLNHGELSYQSLKVKKSLPLLLLSQNGHSSIVDLGRF
ncbi:bile acid beta-glucosidase [Legionella hackeliae]|nr:bile acid beta-glucosidase [Legionella hackeliae]